MSDTRTESVTELEELLDAEIPCGGVLEPPVQRQCGRAATLRWSNPHDCCDAAPAATAVKCPDCWMVLYQCLADRLARDGGIRCKHCDNIASSVLEHTDFRPF